MNSYKDKTKPNTFSSAALGCGMSLLLSLILIAVLAAAAVCSEDPRSFAWLGRAVLFVCAAASGFAAAKLTGEAPFPAGILAGAMYTAVIALASLVSPGSLTFWYIPITLGCSALGAVVGSIRREKKTGMPRIDGKKFNFD